MFTGITSEPLMSAAGQLRLMRTQKQDQGFGNATNLNDSEKLTNTLLNSYRNFVKIFWMYT